LRRLLLACRGPAEADAEIYRLVIEENGSSVGTLFIDDTASISPGGRSGPESAAPEASMTILDLPVGA